jgi:hypothetical protein
LYIRSDGIWITHQTLQKDPRLDESFEYFIEFKKTKTNAPYQQAYCTINCNKFQLSRRSVLSAWGCAEKKEEKKKKKSDQLDDES